ncbi:hypothetical protein GCM10027034_37130 [Ramlibacter solisilvae]|uniref:Microcompartment protein n=1 Tax=Ramlibacter tataouinensis TaxID=94132 RepID=A0A127JUS5_9BURK|nr:hypothetical protein [Ramlibacter tataouinensis]AMO23691.1 microcompartment protein [Ramlibacter tataouinensis]
MAPTAKAAPARPAAELRVCLMLTELQRQFASWMSSPVGARGYVAMQGMHALLIEIAPGLAIQRIVDRALKQEPGLEPGILAVERQFGVLELHGNDEEALKRARQAILDDLGTTADAQLKPQILYSDIVEDITDQHAVLINRTRQANMALPGQSLLLMEVAPALYGAYMGNEAEKAAPDLSLVECSMIGASGRLYLAGPTASLRKAQAHVERMLAAVVGR